jgi:hypothetical protein
MILGPVDLGEDRLTVTRPSSSAGISGNGRHPRPSNTRICSYHLDELMAQSPCRPRAATQPVPFGFKHACPPIGAAAPRSPAWPPVLWVRPPGRWLRRPQRRLRSRPWSASDAG